MCHRPDFAVSALKSKSRFRLSQCRVFHDLTCDVSVTYELFTSTRSGIASCAMNVMPGGSKIDEIRVWPIASDSIRLNHDGDSNEIDERSFFDSPQFSLEDHPFDSRACRAAREALEVEMSEMSTILRPYVTRTTAKVKYASRFVVCSWSFGFRSIGTRDVRSVESSSGWGGRWWWEEEEARETMSNGDERQEGKFTTAMSLNCTCEPRQNMSPT